jgi:hypothetical protein
MGETRNAYRILEGCLFRNRYLEDREGNGNITLRYTLGK